MVAETISLPNLRKMFVPDEGYVIIDADLERADAQVVCWEADDEELKQIFKSGADIHEENGRAIFGVSKCSVDQRDKAKKGVHGANYGVSARTLAGHIGTTVHEAEVFLARWFGAHPKIKAWHKRTAFNLKTKRCIYNQFGFRRYYFDRMATDDEVGRVLPQALAWCPQSTVGIVTNTGLINIEDNLPSVMPLLQVHDSLVLQAPEDECPEVFEKIRQNMLITIPYPDPLIIPVGVKASRQSWGDVEKIELWVQGEKTLPKGLG